MPAEPGQTTSDTAATAAAERDKDSARAPAARFIAGPGAGAPAGPAGSPAGSAADRTGTPVTVPSRPGTATAANPGTGAGEGPLIGDIDRLRASWLRLQAGFVDDPYASVTDAADLVEHAAQALAGALRQRQKMLRDAWSNEAGRPDTEQLRLVMQRYRALFNQICRP